MNRIVLLLYIFFVLTCWWQYLGSTIKSSIFELILSTGIKEWLMNFFKIIISLVIFAVYFILGILLLLVSRYLLLLPKG
ncbi:hypothetical protein CUS10_13295 [Enterococcus faecium]|nr:hypothetical protein CUS10_13295 [Enterococcus faecium]